MKKMIKVSAMMALFVITSQIVFAQVQYKLDVRNSSMVIKGTSTVHDWEMKVENIRSAFTLDTEDILKDKLIAGDIIVDVGDIKSKHTLMTKKTHEALKREQFPQIKAKVVKAGHSSNGGKVQVELSIAGKTRLVNEEVWLKDLGNGKVEAKGLVSLKMSEYNIDPPIALMGSIKTGDEVKIEYHLIYDRERQLLGQTGKGN